MPDDKTLEPTVSPDASLSLEENSGNKVTLKATKKIADHPHWWTILLSSIALVVSSLSYLESHKSRLVNEAVNRPLVRVVSVNCYGSIFGAMKSHGSRQPNGYDLILRNSGKAFADNVRVTYKAQIDDVRVGPQFHKFSDVEDATSDTKEIGDLAPDDEYGVPFWGWVQKENTTIPLGDHTVNVVALQVRGRVSYVNPISQERYQEDFCFIDAAGLGHFSRCADKLPQK